MTDEVTISHLQRRKIEARILIPFIAACRERFGDGPTREVVEVTIQRLAEQDGEGWAERFGNSLTALKAVAEEVWAGGGSLNIDVLNHTSDRLDFNVTGCRYADFYRDLGLPDFGYLFHCNRDHAVIKGFSGDVELTRTQTIMEGAPCCDFRFRKKPTARR